MNVKQTSYLGKRGANAGDDYHELWALRQVLGLLDPSSRLQMVTVEGVALLAGSNVEPDAPAWDGVDCALYFGQSPEVIDRVEFVQVKYSGSSPQTLWTIARLVSARTTRARNSSIVARLAEAYAEQRAVGGSRGCSITLRLVSNQPIDAHVMRVLRADDRSAPGDRKDRDKLANAAKLEGTDLDEFLAVLDFSECGSPNRFELEARVIAELASWTEERALDVLERLRRLIRTRMLPEAHGERLTAETVFAQLGYADRRAFFPRPSCIKPPVEFVPRDIVGVLAARLVGGASCICLHGSGGEGKTTVLQELATHLPAHSVTSV